MFNPGRNIVFVCLCLTFSGVAKAALSDLDRNRLADEVSTARLNLDPNRFPQLDQSKAEVVRRIQIAKSFFQRKTSEQNYNAWMEYLDFDPLLERVEADTSAAAIGREAVELGYRLVGTAPGLELTVLRNLRDSVNRLVASIRFRDSEKSINTLTRQLGSLADRIRQLDERPSADDIAAISAMLDILSTSGQAANVVDSLRNTFSRPNAAVLIGEQLVQTVVSKNVNESRPVNDCILGTRIIGTATMNGQVSVTLMPSTGAARINVALTGTVHSNNIGHNGPVRVRTSGVGQVFASRAMSINESGIGLDPVYVEASMQNQINSIEPKPWLGRRLIKKIASKKAAQQKPQTDRIANFKFRTQVTEQFTTQTNEQAATGIPDFMRDARPVLKRLSLVEPTRLWGSTDNAILIDATMRRRDQMTTVVSRPRITGLFAVAVQIHESAINNAATPILAGRTVNEQQLAELIEATGRESPIGDSDSQDSDSQDSDSQDSDSQDSDSESSDSEEEEQSPFEITFSRLRPVIFEARDQLIRVGVRGTRFAQGSREIRRAMEISTVYKAQTQENGSVILKRVEKVGVDFPGNKRLSVSQAGLKSTIQKKFSSVFPETLLDQPLKVPDTVELEAIRGKVFQPRVVDAMNGWLTIALQ